MQGRPPYGHRPTLSRNVRHPREVQRVDRARDVPEYFSVHLGDASLQDLRSAAPGMPQVRERDADHRVYYEFGGCEADINAYRGAERAAAAFALPGSAGGRI